MKYKTIKIKWGCFDKLPHIEITKEDLDRVKTKTKPHSLGFYNYSETLSDEEAFLELKNFMIKRQKKLLIDVEKEIKQLEELELKKSRKLTNDAGVND
jgi:hypothetical protein